MQNTNAIAATVILATCNESNRSLYALARIANSPAARINSEFLDGWAAIGAFVGQPASQDEPAPRQGDPSERRARIGWKSGVFT